MGTLQPGDEFAGYTIERQLGAGGMGEVYVARHPRLPRRDALKVLAVGLADDESFRKRFEREADVVAGFSNPNIVAVYDRGEFDGRLWIALALVDGVDLGARVKRGPIPVPDSVRYLGEIAAALDDAAAHGLVHRDVKPANILIDRHDRALLTDFGIAQLAAQASELTGTGMTVGTVTFASPEQLRGQAVDARADQYALACTAFLLLTGTVPYSGPSAGAILVEHVTAPVPSAAQRNPHLPPMVDAVFARAMAKDPAQRYPTSRAFAEALTGALGLGPVPATHPQPAPAPAPHAAAQAGQYAGRVDPAYAATATGPSIGTPFGAQPSKPKLSGKLIAGIVAAIAVVIAVVVALVMTLGGSGNGGGDVAGDHVLVTPNLPSLESAPKDPKWTFTPSKPVSTKAVGGNERYVMMSYRDYSSGGAAVAVVDADSGKSVRTISLTIDDSYLYRCHALATGDVVACQALSGDGVFVVIDMEHGTSHVLAGGRSSRMMVSGDTVVIIKDSGDITGYSADGAVKWTARSTASSFQLPIAGSPVIAVTDNTTFRALDAQTGKAVFSADATGGLDPERERNWSAFRDGFTVKNGDAVDIYDAAGTKTSTVGDGWKIVGYELNGDVVATALPVLTNEKTNQTATFDPATGKPVATISLEEAAYWIEGAVGTKVVVAFQSATASASTGDGYAYGWFDAYDGKGGTIRASLPTVLGTDGERLLVTLSTDSIGAFGPDSMSPLWRESLKDRYSVVAAGGKLYSGTSRLL